MLLFSVFALRAALRAVLLRRSVRHWFGFTTEPSGGTGMIPAMDERCKGQQRMWNNLLVIHYDYIISYILLDGDHQPIVMLAEVPMVFPQQRGFWGLQP